MRPRDVYITTLSIGLEVVNERKRFLVSPSLLSDNIFCPLHTHILQNLPRLNVQTPFINFADKLTAYLAMTKV